MKSKNVLASFKYAFTGIKTAFLKERNMKIHFVMAFLVILMGIYFKIKTWEWIALIIVISLVISCEMINTTIEELVNLLSPNIRVEAKNAKDIAAGAVLVFAISSLVIGLIIFLPKVILLFK